jgi:hypothetical protein
MQDDKRITTPLNTLPQCSPAGIDLNQWHAQGRFPRAAISRSAFKPDRASSGFDPDQ